MAPAEATAMRRSIATYQERGSPGSPSRSTTLPPTRSPRRREGTSLSRHRRQGGAASTPALDLAQVPDTPTLASPQCAGPRCPAPSPCGASPTMLARPAPPPTRASPPPCSAIPKVSSTRAVSPGHQINISHFQQTLVTRQEYALRAFVSACDTMQVPTLEDKFLTVVRSHP